MVRNLLNSIDFPHLMLLALVWLPIAFLVVTQHPVPDSMFDAGMLILGYYFRAATVTGLRGG